MLSLPMVSFLGLRHRLYQLHPVEEGGYRKGTGRPALRLCGERWRRELIVMILMNIYHDLILLGNKPARLDREV